LEVTPELDAWFERALHRDPEGRFESAKAMAEALHVAMKSVTDPTSDRKLAVKDRPRASSFVFEEAREAAQYSIVRPGEAEHTGKAKP
jgi:hypothetical protein